MKKLIFMLFITIMTLTLAACQTDKSNDGSGTTTARVDNRTGFTYDFSQQKKETKTIRVWADDTDGFFMEELIKEFNKKHPEIIVQFTHMGTVDARERLQLLGPSGNGADIFQFPHDHLAPALEADLVYALPSKYATSLNDRMSEISMSIATACYTFDAPSGSNPFACNGSNQNVFAAPLSVESVALFYNKDLVTTPVTTFEELVAQAGTYNDPTKGKYLFNTSFNDSYFMTFALTAFGYQPFGPQYNDPNNVGLTSQSVIDGLAWVKANLAPMFGPGTTASNIQALANTQFESGDLPYIITGPWMIESYKKLEFPVGVTTIPTINVNGTDVAPKPFVGAQMAAVYKYSENKEAALTFLEFWTSEEGLAIQYKHKGKLPALKDELIDNIDEIKNDPYLQGIREQIDNTIPMPTIPEIQYYWEPVRIMFSEVWSGANPSDAATKAQNGYQQTRNIGN